MFTGIKVVAFYFFLSSFDGPRDHYILNRQVLRHLQKTHHLAHLFTAKDSHQIVFQRHKKLTLTRITLASGSSSQLVVDTTRLVTLCSQHIQTTQRIYPFTELNIYTSTG